jgi:outer membrane receptor protein involved in Fe transport
MRAQSLMWVNRSNTQSIAGRILVDAGLDLRVLRRPDVVLSFNVTNLGDVETRDLDAYPLPGRAYLATLTVRLDVPRPPATPPQSVSTEETP